MLRGGGAFPDPSYVVGEALAVRKGNPKKLTNCQTISDNEHARVGLIAGTVEYNHALVTGIPADRAPLYRSCGQAIEALKEGELDAVGLTHLTAQGLVDGEPDLEVTPQFHPVLDGEEAKGYGGFAFRKETIRNCATRSIGSSPSWSGRTRTGRWSSRSASAPRWRRSGPQNSCAWGERRARRAAAPPLFAPEH